MNERVLVTTLTKKMAEDLNHTYKKLRYKSKIYAFRYKSS